MFQGKSLVVPSTKKARAPKGSQLSLTPQLKKCIDTCILLLDRNINTQWTRFIIAQDEKWISYNNPDHSFEWCDVDQDPESTSKRPAHGKKEMLCFFFCPEGSVYREVFGKGETVDSTLSCKQLEEMEASHIWRGKILLLMDNVRSHQAKVSQ